ncbi:hypothetical protein [Sporosarcina highlanderae]|uniref:Lipoprotein n=1 Tax=Sporosarcina highlanderae TaxID=3035916 RepID=A0ABT8JVG3_9BACL|nr:hypothetical protein [Sporosarcina highlanderae]MDN4609135.1 hypothetical protein [Sporosarcina highlanderae]
MKKLLIIGVMAMLLVACSSKAKTHENIGEGIAKDTQQVLSILDRMVKEESAANAKEQETLDRYIDKYARAEMTEEEDRVYSYTSGLILSFDGTDYLESDKKDYEEIRNGIKNIIKSGNVTGE